MKIVLDSELLLGLALPRDYSEAAARQVRRWKQAGVELCMPQLGEYEITSGLQQAVSQGLVTAEEAVEALAQLEMLQIASMLPDGDLHRSALAWAGQLGEDDTTAGQYLALAERLEAEFWTADQGLAEQAEAMRMDWVRWIGEDPALDRVEN